MQAIAVIKDNKIQVGRYNQLEIYPLPDSRSDEKELIKSLRISYPKTTNEIKIVDIQFTIKE